MKPAPLAAPTHRRRGAPARKALQVARRADRHEVEADRAADGATRGARDLARTLSPASAASVHVASIGRPLPPGVRARLEQSFGADLDEVRLHHDAAAAAANRAEHARAFAAGRDIYFADGAFAPHTEAGYHLLAHEVAHVLQQTARRRGPARRFAATATVGSGLPQFVKLEELDLTKPGNAALKKLADEHQGLYGKGDADLDHMIQHVIDLTKADFPLATRTAGGDTLAEEAKKGHDGKTAPPRGFLADCLKLMQPAGHVDYYEAVVAIYDADAAAKASAFTIRTRRDPDFLAWLLTAKKGHEEWAVASAEKHKRLRNFWLPAMFELYVQAVTNLWGTPAPLWGVDEVEGGKGRSWKDQVAFLDALTAPDLTERELLAGNLINNLNDLIQQQLRDFFADAAKRKPTDLVGQRIIIADDLRLSSRANRANPTFPKYLQPFFDKLIALGDNAFAMWSKQTGLRSAGSLTDYLTEMPVLATLLVDAATAFAQMPTSASAGAPPLPTSTGFKAGLAALKDALVGQDPGVSAQRAGKGGDSLLAVLQRSIARALRAGKGPAAGLAALVADLNELVLAIDRYKPSDDKGPYTDVRDFHRWNVAGLLLGFGARMKIGAPGKLTELHAALDAIVAGEGIARLVVTGDWLPDASAVPDDMLEDIGAAATPVFSGTPDNTIPITVRAYVNFFRRQFLDDLNIRYTAILGSLDMQRRLGLLSSKTTFPQPEALAAAKAAIAQPARFKPNGGAAFIPTLPEGALVAELYFSSQKTVDELDHATVPGSTAVYPPKLGFQTQFFAWVLPPLDDLVKWLRGPADSPLAKAVAAAAGPGVTIADGDTLGWLNALIAAAKLDPTIAAQVSGRITDAPGGFMDALHQNVDLQRQLENDFRRLYVERVRVHLKSWADDQRGPNLGERFLAMKQLFEFSANTPFLGRDDQVCLLLLDLAPLFEQSFDTLGHSDLQIVPFLDAMIDATVDSKEKPLKRFLALVDDQAELDALLANRPKAVTLRDRLMEQRKSQQQDFGLRSLDGRTLQGYVFNNPIEPKDEFMIDGIGYMLVKVHRPFAYHPGLDAPAPTTPIYKETDEGPALKPTGQPLFTVIAIEGETQGSKLDNNTQSWAGEIWSEKYKGRVDEDGKPLNQVTDPDPERFVVTDQHAQMLKHMSHVVEMRANQIGLEQTAEVMEFVAQIIITAAEIFLPGGQVIGVMETMASVAQVIQDPDVHEMVARLFDDPVGFFEDLGSKIADSFTIEGMIELLIGSGKFAGWLDVLGGLVGHSSAKPDRTEMKSKPTGMLGKIFRFVVNLGKKLAEIFKKSRHYIRGPLGALRSTIVTRPKLGWFLDTAVDLVLRAVDFIQDHPDLLDIFADIESWITASLKAFLASLSGVQLPDKIIPVEGILTFFVDFVVGKIPKLKLVRPILEATGLDTKIAHALNKAFDLDNNEYIGYPNKLYKEQFLDKYINPTFIKLRNGVIDDLVSVINSGASGVQSLLGIELKGFPLTGPGHEDVVPEQVDMLTPFPAAGEKASVDVSEIPGADGKPIRPETRRAVEHAFGQDFRHVRLHDDGPSDHLTRKLGAHALTTGSHVFVRSDFNLGTAFGRRILDHELGHVVEQMGSRPLGQEHDARPSTPPARAALHLDLQREAAADRLAARAKGGGRIPSRLTSKTSLQPFIFSPETIEKIVGAVTHLNKEGDFEERAPSGEDIQGKDKAAEVWTNVKAALRDTGKAKFATYLKSPGEVIDAIIKHVTKGADIKGEHIDKIAELAQRNLPKKKQTDDVKTELNVGRFVTLLEGFVYAHTGVAIQISGPKQDANDVTKVEVGYVNLGAIGGTSTLWQIVMADPDTKTIDKDATKLQLEIRQRLIALGPDPFLWDSAAFKLSKKFRDKFTEFKALRASAGKPDEVPLAAAYAKLDTTDPSNLRLGTHGTIRKGGIGKFARESHHTTQFLLIEYFRNRTAPLKAFPEPMGSYASALKISSGSDGFINSVIGKNVGKFDTSPTRGDNMPAILIAAETHRRGKLHINASDSLDDDADANEPDQGSTQGEKVATWFRSKMTDSALADAHKAGDGDAFGKAIRASATARAQIDAGMRYAYNRMYEGHMKGRLEGGLKTIERAYYEGIAARNHSADGKLAADYQLTDTLLDPIIAKAQKNNSDAFDADWK